MCKNRDRGTPVSLPFQRGPVPASIALLNVRRDSEKCHRANRANGPCSPGERVVGIECSMRGKRILTISIACLRRLSGDRHALQPFIRSMFPPFRLSDLRNCWEACVAPLWSTGITVSTCASRIRTSVTSSQISAQIRYLAPGGINYLPLPSSTSARAATIPPVAAPASGRSAMVSNGAGNSIAARYALDLSARSTRTIC